MGVLGVVEASPRAASRAATTSDAASRRPASPHRHLALAHGDAHLDTRARDATAEHAALAAADAAADAEQLIFHHRALELARAEAAQAPPPPKCTPAGPPNRGGADGAVCTSELPVNRRAPNAPD